MSSGQSAPIAAKKETIVRDGLKEVTVEKFLQHWMCLNDEQNSRSDWENVALPKLAVIKIGLDFLYK